MTVAVVELVGVALVRAGAEASGVVKSTGAEGALGVPFWLATEVVVYCVLGVRPGTRQLMVRQVVVIEVPPVEGHMVTS